MFYGQFLDAFTGFCYVTKGQMSCMTKQQAHETIWGFLFTIFIVYLILYRLKH